MNWKEVQEWRREAQYAPDDAEMAKVMISLYRTLLLACAPYVPEVSVYGVDRRAIEEALRDE